jgi:hypothetical protein
MRILFVADGRSPIALSWMRYFAERHAVHLASTFQCTPDLPLQSLQIIPVAFSGVRKSGTAARRASGLGLRTALRQWLGPLTIARAARDLRALTERLRPDLVHALRIPYEGMLAADAYCGVPLVVSVWGNDFTLHAPSTPLMRHYTSWTLRAAHALHADCRRDVRLARDWGLSAARPTLVAPGNGGVATGTFFPPPTPAASPVVVNPRGFRAYVRNDAFFQAIPLVLAHRPDARFVCLSMAGEPAAVRWTERLNIGHAVELLPRVPHAQVGGLLRRAQVLVSPGEHDGTPNTLLEGMACGCFPVAGDLESLREWITPGENGLLVDPADPHALAGAILTALENKSLREKAAGLNAGLVAERADYSRNMPLAERFYEQVMRLN